MISVSFVSRCTWYNVSLPVRRSWFPSHLCHSSGCRYSNTGSHGDCACPHLVIAATRADGRSHGGSPPSWARAPGFPEEPGQGSGRTGLYKTG